MIFLVYFYRIVVNKMYRKYKIDRENVVNYYRCVENNFFSWGAIFH